MENIVEKIFDQLLPSIPWEILASFLVCASAYYVSKKTLKIFEAEFTLLLNWKNWNFGSKFMLSLVLILGGFCLSWVGFSMMGTLMPVPAEAIEKTGNQQVPQKKNTATSGDGGLSVANNSGIINYNSTQTSEISKPAVSMNVESSKDNPFETEFSILNGGKINAENVKVGILYFDYFGKTTEDGYQTTFTLGQLSESNNVLRNLGLIEAGGGRVNTRITDLVVYDRSKYPNIIANLQTGARFFLESADIKADRPLAIIAVAPEEREHLDTTLVCFNVSYQWTENKEVKHDNYKIGFLIDRNRPGFENWLKRSDFCSDEFIESRKARAEGETR